jgi:threonine synthase
MDVLRRALTDEGIRGLYKGISANMMRGVGQKGIYFYCYEQLKELMSKSKTSSEMSL